MSLQKFVRPIFGCAVVATSICTFLFAVEVRAGTFAARIANIGTSNATSASSVTVQTSGPTLFVQTSNANNLGDLSLLRGAATEGAGGVPFKQSEGVIIAAPNQFQYSSTTQRNMIETPGELIGAIPGGFPNGMWLSTTRVEDTGFESNFRLAMAYFPYADGWTAAHVKGDGTGFWSGNTTGVTMTPLFDLPAGTGLGHYSLAIAGVDSRFDGMLYAMSEVNSASGNVVPVGIVADGSGWDIRVNDQSQSFGNGTEQANWSFVYVPYDAQNLVAAGNLRLDTDISATDVTILRSHGTFTAERVDLGTNSALTNPATVDDGIKDAGRFLIKITGKTDLTGYLMVGSSKNVTSGSVTAADDNMLTWEYDATLGGFLVESYDLAGAGLQDSDIYFAYFDYENPILPTPEPGTAALVVIGLLALQFGAFRRRAAV